MTLNLKNHLKEIYVDIFMNVLCLLYETDVSLCLSIMHASCYKITIFSDHHMRRVGLL